MDGQGGMDDYGIVDIMLEMCSCEVKLTTLFRLSL